MIARVFRYSFAQARTKALKGKLLSAEDWHYLLQMRTLEDLFKYLSGTDYAPVLARVLPGQRLRLASLPWLYTKIFSRTPPGWGKCTVRS
jgi:vacuolar-type H+-ATPase subunit C/Vma6